MERVERMLAEDVPTLRVQALFELLNRVWPREGVTLEEQVGRFPLSSEGNRIETVFAVWEGARAVAQAWSFRRRILTEAGALEILALAAVCCDPDWRGRGFGRAVVEHAFAQLREGDAPGICLFQTGIPEFYRRLGAREVENRFRNGRDPMGADYSPWWNPHVMIYPDASEWPTGVVDLNGPGY